MPTRSFWIVAGLLLVWSLIGDAAYLSQVTADLAKMATTDPSTAKAFAAMPEWAWSAYAVAVWVSTLAAIALLLRRRIAAPLYAVSLVAVLVQFGWTFLGSDVIADKGASAAIFPLIIIAIAAFSLWYSWRKAQERVLR
ncbi:sugar transporter [Novosphingobium sp. Gsoil 351]|uniref:sugar transporter n=1 Tax=Novosphingobium sp. Gsoil 351 TaxID=2675225 RepID=UPI0012B47922|nr:sugar transporter [Novosphingobium sp. Gsoil 351]QGN55605.1 sugar transporter [Novosphingobium sp. Gsoil 351]